MKSEGCIQDRICHTGWKQSSCFKSTVLSKCTGNWPKMCVFVWKHYKKIYFQYWSAVGKTCWNGKITNFLSSSYLCRIVSSVSYLLLLTLAPFALLPIQLSRKVYRCSGLRRSSHIKKMLSSSCGHLKTDQEYSDQYQKNTISVPRNSNWQASVHQSKSLAIYMFYTVTHSFIIQNKIMFQSHFLSDCVGNYSKYYFHTRNTWYKWTHALIKGPDGHSGRSVPCSRHLDSALKMIGHKKNFQCQKPCWRSSSILKIRGRHEHLGLWEMDG